MAINQRSPREQAFLDARRAPRLNDEEIIERLERAFSLDHWRGLCPGLSVGRIEPLPHSEDKPLGVDQRQSLVKRLARDGYLKTDPVLAESVINAIKQALITLREHGWPP